MSANTPVAAFFDLDKTIIATSSAFAFGKEFLNNGMITRQEAWELYITKAQYMLVGQSSEKMDSTRDALAQMVAGWDVKDIQRITRDTLREVVAPAGFKQNNRPRAPPHLKMQPVPAHIHQRIEGRSRRFGQPGEGGGGGRRGYQTGRREG